MKRVRYPAEFKAEAVKQVTERGHGVVDVAKRLGMSDKSLYLWVRLAKEQSSAGGAETSQLKAEVSRLKAELKRANEERDIPKKGRNVLCQAVRVKCAFMAEHKGQFRLSSMCRVLRVQRSGYYAWKANPKSKRALADDVLLASIRQSFDDSHGIYGSPRILRDLREDGMACGQKRVARLMRQAQLRSVRGYKRPRYRVGLPATAAPNRLQREFTVTLPNQVWVTDITYIRTHEGWLYLTAVIDLYSRMVVGWAMNSSMATELVLDALTMAVWRRRPTGPVMIHSDQGSQFGSDDFARWCKDNQLVPSMSRRGNCWDNAVAESFFSSLKKERIKRHIYATRQDAKSDVFDYIEGFYNRIRRHSHLDQLSPLAFEQLRNGS
ncbi:IS3 family transposase [Acidovorax sp. 1608163]|nr:IS3 family transposase [Acidovorax sp. 1608163]AYM97125.1 IS3 family transposase [Acidovorax sp. 1608163]AYM97591.1 IS3 family transposase [Acidovorax sp. 1608163]AYM98105.1 IS3 family transposase [Acidovorax sp. 1608163]